MKNEKGFTLIELLVVVLIIGILAAIALPQYRKAVEKSRAVETKNLIRAVSTAQQDYKLTTGNWAGDLSQLIMEFPNYTFYNYSAVTPSENRIVWNDRVMVATPRDGVLVGMPRRGNDCQGSNSLAIGNNSCYMFYIDLNSNVLRCVNGTRAPVKWTCEDIGEEAS
jgi:prepilin-type N-terminal cleavage/methylation domain-containing protein